MLNDINPFPAAFIRNTIQIKWLVCLHATLICCGIILQGYLKAFFFSGFWHSSHFNLLRQWQIIHHMGLQGCNLLCRHGSVQLPCLFQRLIVFDDNNLIADIAAVRYLNRLWTSAVYLNAWILNLKPVRKHADAVVSVGIDINIHHTCGIIMFLIRIFI